MPEVASRVVADLGALDLVLDVFSSGTSAHLRVCEKYWSAQDSAWKKHWGPHQGLMWIHCPRWDIQRAVAKIRKDRSKAVLVVPMGCTEEESTRHWVVSAHGGSRTAAQWPLPSCLPPCTGRSPPSA